MRYTRQAQPNITRGEIPPVLKLKARPPPLEQDEAECLTKWAAVARLNTRYGFVRASEYLLMIPNGAYLGDDPIQRKITMGRTQARGL